MQSFNEQLVERIDQYIQELFAPADDILAANLAEAVAARLPDIQVSPNQGKLLYLLAKIAGAKRVLEIGTLGGYSTTWLARALPAGGSVLSLEFDPHHAEVARRSLDRAALPVPVEIRIGPAADSLRELIRTGAKPFDLVFIDADKTGYTEYLDLTLQLSHPGTLILADNVVRHGAPLADHPEDDADRAIKAFNEKLARHPRLESLILPIIRERIDGLSISVVR